MKSIWNFGYGPMSHGMFFTKQFLGFLNGFIGMGGDLFANGEMDIGKHIH